MRLLFRWAALALAFWAATSIVPGITVNGKAGTYLWVALLFGLINAFFGSVVKILTFPVTLVTFGLFIFIVNAAMLMLTARWSDALYVKDFWTALWASLIISVITALLRGLFKKSRSF
ncbi:MAG: phage holin family protein [Actinobacteria bacterium]|nr:phage holin family protein [Actinomycetota bacterium]